MINILGELLWAQQSLTMSFIICTFFGFPDPLQFQETIFITYLDGMGPYQHPFPSVVAVAALLVNNP